MTVIAAAAPNAGKQVTLFQIKPNQQHFPEEVVLAYHLLDCACSWRHLNSLRCTVLRASRELRLFPLFRVFFLGSCLFLFLFSFTGFFLFHCCISADSFVFPLPAPLISMHSLFLWNKTCDRSGCFSDAIQPDHAHCRVSVGWRGSKEQKQKQMVSCRGSRRCREGLLSQSGCVACPCKGRGQRRCQVRSRAHLGSYRCSHLALPLTSLFSSSLSALAACGKFSYSVNSQSFVPFGTRPLTV